MNSLFLISVRNYFRQISSIQNITTVPFSAIDVSRSRENIQTIANAVEKEEPQLSAELIQAREALFATNVYGQAFVNPVALGAVVFGLDLLVNKEQAQKKESSDSIAWSYMHPLIQKASRQLFNDGHYANAAEDAFIEINDRVKKLFVIVKPGCRIPDGEAAMTTVFSNNNPLIEFCDRSTDTGANKQKGYMQMLAGAMSALRNPKAHSNNEILTAEEAYRRLATASMLMYAIDEAVKYSGINER